MAEFVLKNAYVMVSGVDLSDHVRQVNIDYSAETPEDTAMGDTAKSRLPGLLDWKVDIEFNQDFGSSKVDATLFDLVGAAAFAIHIKPVNAAISATNPDFTGSCLLSAYPPIGGKVGDTAITKATFMGTGVLTRDIIP